jgi:segregation and condensation protein A
VLPSSETPSVQSDASAERVFVAGGSVCAVKLAVFEGPLDLLLHLIRANEVDVEDIPIARISEQYLDYLELMRELDIDVAAEYLLMAATLAQIKSRMLLPRDPDGSEEDEGEDPRAELARRLAEFATFKEAARSLDERALLGRDVFLGAPDRSHLPIREPVLELHMADLIAAMRRVLESLPAEVAHHQVMLERFSVQETMLDVLERLRAVAERSMLFEDLLRAGTGPLTRGRVIATFLALLELTKIQAVRLYQNAGERGEPLGSIRARLPLSESEEQEAADAAEPAQDVHDLPIEEETPGGGDA